MKKNYLLYFLLLTFSCFAQFSKTHYIPPLSGSNTISSSAQEQYLYISTPNINPVNFRIIQLGGTVINATVSKSTPYVYNIGFGATTQLMTPRSQVSTVRSNKGYIIEAEDLVYVSARVIAGSANQAGSLVSKGLAALGTDFRVGSLLNTSTTVFNDNHYTFVSVLATENNTVVQFDDIKPNARLINMPAGNSPVLVTLNAGESYVIAVDGPHDDNRDALIGSSVHSDKPIAVNCGSFCGSNATTNLDTGFDQIVSVERTGKDYIFIKNTGQAQVEKVLLVAHENNTQIYLSGNVGTPDYTIEAGEYLTLDGNDFTAQGNLYVRSSKNIFAYQTIGDDSRPDFANQELFFVPPLSCETPHVIDNVPLVNQVGTRTFPISRITFVTATGSNIDIEVDGVSQNILALGFLPGVTVVGPTSVVGNANYVTYSVNGLSGNIGAFSTSPLYMAAYGTDGAATFGGFYSGFTFKPEIVFSFTSTNCIPNTTLTVNTLSAFDVFQWYYNGNPIPGETNSSYVPLQPGYYYLKGTISNCGTTLTSDNIPISSCPEDFDGDGVNDNIDMDSDNDGIADCTESLGNQNVDLSNLSDPTILVNTAGSAPPSPNPFVGTTTGDFVTEAAIGKNNSVTIRKNFAQPTSVMLSYVMSGNSADLLNADGEFTLNCDLSRTITVLNPNNQLLIDTNFDGIYESGVTRFSSFEIRFRFNSSVPLAAGSGTFQFKSSLTNTIAFTHKNMSDLSANRATFKLIVTCVPRDTDGDGVTDNFDSDNDNDGIPDVVEAQGPSPIVVNTTDANQDGMYDVFGIGINPIDTDGDGVPDYIDLDSDNDGIYDLVESGSGATDANLDGMVDGSTFGNNGLSDALETAPESGILSYTIPDTDGDGIYNYRELDSDDDGCYDTVEVGNSDNDHDGLVGDNPVVVNSNGVVTNASGYSVLPNNNYITYAPIGIITQPTIAAVCELGNTSATIVTSPVDSYQWQRSIGGIWTNISNSAIYSGTTTDVLQISNATLAMNGWTFRVVLQKNGNTCGSISATTTLVVYALPVISSPHTLIQCDEDGTSNGITDVNLRQKESFISTNYASEIFEYYTSLSEAQIGNNTISNPDYISNPNLFNTGNTIVYVRVKNANGCFRIARLDVFVTATRIPSSFHRNFYQCDDFLDTNGNNNANNNNRDGIATFNFSSVTADIMALLPSTSTFSIKYYKNAADANAETDESGNSLEISQNATDPTSIYNYRNIEFPNQQDIYIRVESDVDNSCFGLGAYVTLIIEKLPVINPVNADNLIRHCDDDQDGIYGFNTAGINAAILGGQTNVALSYFDASGNPLPSPLPNPFLVTGSTTITVKAVNTATLAPDGPCAFEGSFGFLVDYLPYIVPINSTLLEACDDEMDPLLQDGYYSFNTSTFETKMLDGQTGLVVTYADFNGNALPSPLPNPYIANSRPVTVKVTNPINPNCAATYVLNFKVNPLPKIDLNADGDDNELICVNLPALTATLDAGLSAGIPVTDYTYQWYLDGLALAGETSSTLTVNTGGQYAVEVTNSFSCTRTRQILVTVSEIASIEHIQIIDLVDLNTVQVYVSGTGDYIYSLDHDDTHQSSNYFYDVLPGVHQVYVKDVNGCGTAGPVEIYVLGVPKYFTPNGDGFNDTWNIRGVNEKSNPNAVIRIFDRYGKFLKEISSIGLGWDGTMNGNPLPADDYWYNITLEDNRVIKGHFALKR